MIEWLNQNEGAVQAILTVVYVISTVLLVRFSIKQFHLANRLEKARVRPYVVFDLEFRDFMVMAVLRNRGLTPATDVRITTSRPLLRRGSGEAEPVALVQNTISFLAPGRELTDFVDSGPGFYQRYGRRPVFEGSLEYFDQQKERYTEHFKIDLSFGYDLESREPDVEGKLDGIRKAIEDLVRHLSQSR